MSRYDRERVAARQRSFMHPPAAETAPRTARELDPVREVLAGVRLRCERTASEELTPFSLHGAWQQVVSAQLARVRGWGPADGARALEAALLGLAAVCVRSVVAIRRAA